MFCYYMKRVGEQLSFLIAPPYCVGCKKFLEVREPFCVDCRIQINPVISLPLPITAHKEIQVYAMTSYEGVIRSMVLAKQYGQMLPSVQLGYLLATSDCCPWSMFDILIPVPLHWRRYALRGFNQAEIIAQSIAARHGLKVLPALKRVRHTKLQATLVKTERLKNVESCFEIDAHYIPLLKGKRVLLVDDVMTTGATLREMGRALKRAELELMAAVVVARTL